MARNLALLLLLVVTTSAIWPFDAIFGSKTTTVAPSVVPTHEEGPMTPSPDTKPNSAPGSAPIDSGEDEDEKENE
ncbi:hypothetical protein RB195_005250 [Necator americanus]